MTASSVIYNSSAATATTQTAKVTATSVSDPSKSQTTTITISPTITVRVTSSPSTISAGRSAALTATTNDPKGVTWGLTSGAGSLSSRAATSATYNAPGTVSSAFTANVSATSVSDSTISASVAINVVVPLSISTNLPAGTYTLPYQGTVTAAGGVPPYTITLSGTLPSGLTFSSGVVTGAPTYPGNNGGSFSFIATDSATPPNTKQTAVLSIKVNVPTSLTILTRSLPGGTVGGSYKGYVYLTGGTPPYTYGISAGTFPPGLSLTSSSPIIVTGTPTTAGTYNFTLKLTDFAIPPNVATANFSITIQPAVTITTTSLPNGTVGMAYATPVQVTGGQPPYSFSETGAPVGINPESGALAGVPDAAGLSIVKLSVTDTNNATGSANLSIDITAESCPNNANFSGNYAFQFNGPYQLVQGGSVSGQVIGSFLADGAGNITQGYIDDGVAVTSTGVTGSYCIGANNLGTMEFPPGDGTVYLIELDSSGGASATQFQNFAGEYPFPFSSGVILKQDPTTFASSNITGNYSFSFLGDIYLDAYPNLQAGTFSADGAGNLTGELDSNGRGNPANMTFNASDLAVAPFGRGTVTLNEPGGATESLIFYIVNASRLVALAYVPQQSGRPLYTMTGPVVQSAGVPYTNNSLNGTSVIELQESVSSVVQLGLVSWDGSGNFTLSADQNSAGTLSAPAYGGTYSVASNGRVTLTANGQSSTPVLYLTGPNQGFVIGTDANISYGQILSQSGSPFNNATFSGNYLGLNVPIISALSTTSCNDADLELDNFTADGAGTLTGTSYLNNYVCGPSWIPVSGTYAVSSAGRGVVTENGSTNSIFYIVSPTQAVSMPSTATYPNLIMLSHP